VFNEINNVNSIFLINFFCIFFQFHTLFFLQLLEKKELFYVQGWVLHLSFPLSSMFIHLGQRCYYRAKNYLG
jgi:hypothetical protein